MSLYKYLILTYNLNQINTAALNPGITTRPEGSIGERKSKTPLPK